MRQRKPPGPFHEFLRARIKHGDRRAIANLLGISEGNFGSWLRRGSEPGIYAAQKVAAHYGVSLDYLITGEDFLAGKDPRIVEICRLLLQIEGDNDFLQPLEAMIRERIRQKASSGGAQSSITGDATEDSGTEEDQAQSPCRGS